LLQAPISRSRENSGDWKWSEVGKATVGKDKILGDFFEKHGITSHTGAYRFTFGLEKYFEAMGVTPVFLEAVVVFNITDQAHDHIPVEITPYTISTYRGE